MVKKRPSVTELTEEGRWMDAAELVKLITRAREDVETYTHMVMSPKSAETYMMSPWLAPSLGTCHPSGWLAYGACSTPSTRGSAFMMVAAGVAAARGTGWSFSARTH